MSFVFFRLPYYSYFKEKYNARQYCDNYCYFVVIAALVSNREKTRKSALKKVQSSVLFLKQA